jgi:hypothetical protein
MRCTYGVSQMNPNQRRALTHVSYYFEMRDSMMETCDLSVFVLHADASQLCLSYVLRGFDLVVLGCVDVLYPRNH